MPSSVSYVEIAIHDHWRLFYLMCNVQLEVNVSTRIRNPGTSYILALRNPATGAGDIALFEEQREQVLQMVEFLEEQQL